MMLIPPPSRWPLGSLGHDLAVPWRWALLLLLVCGPSACVTPKKQVRDPSPKEMEAMRYRMAEELVARRDYQHAAPYLRALLNKHPHHPRLHLLLGKVLREKGVYQGAEGELRRAIALAPKDPDAHAALAVLFARQKKFKVAEKHHRRALELAPKQARLHNDLGVCLLAQRRLPEAQQALEEALRLDPSSRRAFNNLGFVLGLMGKPEAALKAFTQAGSRAMAYTNLGVVAEMRGQPGSARRHYERALREQQDYGPALRNLKALEPGGDHGTAQSAKRVAPPASQPAGAKGADR